MRAFLVDLVPTTGGVEIARWQVMLTHDGRTMQTTMYGPEPTVEGVLAALASDAAMTRAAAADSIGDNGTELALWERMVKSVERVFGSVDAFLNRVPVSA